MTLQNIGYLDRSNLAISVADALRDSIARGELPPGTHLVEVELARQLGVSRGPLREALRILESEGLVTSYRSRGSFVSEMTERDIREIYSLRMILEEEAIRLAARRGTPEALDDLETTLKAMLEAANAGDLAQVLDLDIDFHRQIWEMADHTRLKDILGGIAIQVKMYVAVQTKLYDDLAMGVSDHETFLEALRAGDEKGAAKAMRKHLQEAEDTVMDYLLSKQSKS
jgi:DNA-binding GntR family transcriptional regulator